MFIFQSFLSQQSQQVQEDLDDIDKEDECPHNVVVHRQFKSPSSDYELRIYDQVYPNYNHSQRAVEVVQKRGPDENGEYAEHEHCHKYNHYYPHLMVKSSGVKIAYMVKAITIARVMHAATTTTWFPLSSATIAQM